MGVKTERMALTKGLVTGAMMAIGQGDRILSDSKSKGLALRVRATTAIWCLRGRLGPAQKTWRIGDARHMPDPETAREHAAEALKLIRRGVDPEERLRELENDGETIRHFDNRDGWTWEVARTKFLDHVKRNRAEATYRDYRNTLNSADFEAFNGLLLKHLDRRRAKKLQDAIAERGVPTMARHALRILKTMQTWCANRADSGIETSLVANVAPLEDGRDDVEPRRPPPPEQLGALPWRVDVANCTPQTRLAALLVLLTAQRINTVLSAKITEFTPCQDGGIWTMPRAHMKGKRPHVIPLPPATWDVVTQALAVAHSQRSAWLFPKVKVRRAGGDASGHLSYRPVAEVLSPLHPHDMRRAFATWGAVFLGMKLSDAKAILHHAEGLSGDVTAQFYALHDGTHFKWGLMRDWEDWILRQVRAAAPMPDARLRCLLCPTDGPDADQAIIDNVRQWPMDAASRNPPEAALRMRSFECSGSRSDWRSRS